VELEEMIVFKRRAKRVIIGTAQDWISFFSGRSTFLTARMSYETHLANSFFERYEFSLEKVMVNEEAWRDVPPSYQEMLPIARKMVKDQVKNELADYLKQK
jgi:hypothetical protein